MLHNEIVNLRKSLSLLFGIDSNIDAMPNKSLDTILREACSTMNVSVQDAISRTRQYDKCIARALFITYCHKHNMGTLTEIGRMVKRDHSTVIHALKMIDNDILFEKKYKSFESKIKTSYALIH